MTTRRCTVDTLMAAGLCLATVVTQAQSPDWPRHDLNLAKTRFAALDQITPANVDKLTVAWSFDARKYGDGLGRVTPLLIDGVLYIRGKAKMFAVQPATGILLWSAPIVADESGASLGARGATYGDGRLYVTTGQGLVTALDAKSGKPVASFGDNGILPIVAKALQFKYPGKYAESSARLGYDVVTPAVYYDGTLYVAVGCGDNHVRGGLMIAADATTGVIRWVFSTIPQDPNDEGWDVAGPTWRGGARAGGGVWTTPAIDPELGLLYFNVGNPSPAYDGSARKGSNLFSNSVVALRLATGKLAWHFQALHHEIWDLDVINGPVLVDGTVDGKSVKAVVAAGKTCYAYILDRQTGAPINPIVETAVPMASDLPGEEVWPTQPVPYTRRGTPQQPFCATLPRVTDQALVSRVRPMFTPFSTKEFLIVGPGTQGGAGWQASSFSPRTGLYYVAGQNSTQSWRIKGIGDRAVQGPGYEPFRSSQGQSGPTGVPLTLSVAAYDPMTGVQAWITELAPHLVPKGGNLVTAGDVLFQAAGSLHALDARSGLERWTWKAPESAGINGDPMMYEAGGKQYVAVPATNNTVFTFALP